MIWVVIQNLSGKVIDGGVNRLTYLSLIYYWLAVDVYK